MISTFDSPLLICLIIFRNTPNTASVAAEYDLCKFNFFARNSVQETITYLGKIAAERTPMGVRQSIEQNGHILHIYSNMTGLSGFVGCKKEYPTRVAFALIDKALDTFSAKVSKDKWMSCSRPIESAWLKDLFRLHKNPADADSLTRIQQELDETTIIAHKILESALERGENLDEMISKSSDLGILSKEFLKSSRKTNTCCIIQ